LFVLKLLFDILIFIGLAFLKLGFFYLGLPLRFATGRAVSQLAARSALQRFQRFGLALRATAAHPSACGGCAACRAQKKWYSSLRSSSVAIHPPTLPSKEFLKESFGGFWAIILVQSAPSRRQSRRRPSDATGWPSGQTKALKAPKGRAISEPQSVAPLGQRPKRRPQKQKSQPKTAGFF